ncbi:leucine-rich repeat domain, L domain-like protein [Artemisia annua]|uniref:Leucine-rich repeat domain, L domain-like protein n=1 Tax=Artemisia annua TaxID=35608 RepID=A0A2U1KQT7_ARTAN|nr:leucine-rich repeat domain, L domain-like protein [Artemisia annua]
MEALQNIWPYQFCSSGEANSCILREIGVIGCHNLVNIFPSNPMPLLHHLIDLRVEDCGSIEFLFNIDVRCNGEIEEGCSSLGNIEIQSSGEIREVWRLKGVSNPDVIIRGFEAVKSIYTDDCKSFRNLFTPTFASFDLGALDELYINGADFNGSVERSHEVQMNDINRGEILQVDDIIPDVKVAIPFHVLSTFHHLRRLNISRRADVEVAFEIESATSKDLATSQRDNQQSPLLPYLEFLSLEEIGIYNCDAIEEVVSNRDDEYEEIATSSQTNTTFLPHFDYLYLSGLPHLKLIDGTDSNITSSTNSIHDHFKVGFASPSLCQYSRKIDINTCETLATLIPFSAVGKLQKLEELQISSCRSLREIFEIKRVNKNGSDSVNVGDILSGLMIPRSANMTLLELPNLKILRIIKCDLLEHVFTSSTFDSLKQLIELTIKKCNAMQVIVKEDEHHDSKTVLFPRLKSLTLTDLPNVEGFFLGINEFLWSILDEVKIYGCPKMKTFTSGRSITPKLLYIHSGLGKHSLECGLNFPLSSASHEETQFPWSFSNLVEVNGQLDTNLLKSGILFPCNELIKLQNLEKLYIKRKEVKVIFEVLDMENDDVNEKQSVVVFPKLKEVILTGFDSVSLLQLHELEISRCDNMDVIVKKAEDSESRATDVVVFCSLKSIKLRGLPNLKGFCLGMEDFLWQSLDTLEIKDCPQISVFTCGQSTTPQLKVIDTSFGLCYATEDPTSFIKAKQQEGLQF